MPAWRWAALLGFALVAPISLPAGGGERRQPELRRRLAGEPLLSQSSAPLAVSPSRRAPVLASVMRDQPLRVLRRWQATSDDHWLLVETPAGSD
ncbi:MAG: SH3 domain-containing protein, partial [Cyanobium sp.]